MDILVLGGTRFVGRHLVLALLERGHRVSVFTRGKSGDDLPAEVERLQGDRDGDLGALQGRRWDACADVSGYVPRVVRQSAALLEGAVRRYLFVSTVSVYADGQTEPITEDRALATLSDPASENVAEDYGALKVACERAVQEIYGERATIVRPGLVAGPYDPTGRFTHWALRAAQGGVALAPGDGQDVTQVIDARDLGAFMAHLLEDDIGGTFNAVGEPHTFSAFLDEVASGVGTRPEWRWLSLDDQQRLSAEGVWPVYAPREPILNVQPERARAAGLQLRPLADTARDTLEWARTSGAGGAGPDREKEAGWLAQLG
ncbi:NAD-dependent epimerase [Deinococcus irradiatisoli]|uniref:NAD-dependent epimerase n=1 Tax=Deinococcus irradiatisoli TaxID=2202254 RepID=A0A2Z3JAF0_9DEIO|nr:NAD-dependent epimerase/dehydratase family protein [Deinococcus irradiatisoli]AWN22073.1 NAD-dependent epimerase [Deinococcus irradiatisoli]